MTGVKRWLALLNKKCMAGMRGRVPGVVWLAVALLGLTPASRAAATDGMAAFREGQYAEALLAWEQAAASGDARAALLVGVLFDTGEGVAPDAAMAMQWYRRAAEAGNAAGMFNVAVMYDAGRAVPQDRPLAASWYQRAADHGYGRAAFNLALMYEAGDGVPRDPARAIALFRLAAAHGIVAARVHLPGAIQRAAALGAPGGDDTALQEFRQAQRVLVSRGIGEASHAVELFRRAAENHNVLAEYDLAYCYEHGIGVPADRFQAYVWYRRAAVETTSAPLRAIAQTGARGLVQDLSQGQLRQADNQIGTADGQQVTDPAAPP
jgi:TPR repeat protein